MIQRYAIKSTRVKQLNTWFTIRGHTEKDSCAINYSQLPNSTPATHTELARVTSIHSEVNVLSKVNFMSKCEYELVHLDTAI